ncbi:lysosomal amino acid transporter 1 homolog [Babylonia areolata]|uniref:lysosomal amino acid transporter 1 homolog n=1 Tax=Babylonia areolata TaxID=304850 RepID=UPI003FCFDFBA
MGPFYTVDLTSILLLGNGSSNTTSDCPEGNQFIWNTFEQCIHTPLQWVSFAIGLASIAFWLGVLLPQIVENCKNMNCVASISAGLLLSWIFGDTTNLVGAFLTKQGLIQVLLGVWFVLTDLLLMGQLFYYHCVFKRRHREANLGDETKRLVLCLMGMMCMSAAFSGIQSPAGLERGPRAPVGRQLLSIDPEEALESQPFFKDSTEILGYILGIVSSIAYFTSRSFQIYKNYTQRNVKGLSTVTFVMAILGNLLYGLAIVLYSVEKHYTLMHLPWLVGSWGIMFMDLTIVIQIKRYSKEEVQTLDVPEPDDDEVSPLVNPINNSDYGAVYSNGNIV